jgi:putative hemolysin
MNRLTEDEQEAALRCIMAVSESGGRATEILPSGKAAYAYLGGAGEIDWGVSRRWQASVQSRAQR